MKRCRCPFLGSKSETVIRMYTDKMSCVFRFYYLVHQILEKWGDIEHWNLAIGFGIRLNSKVFGRLLSTLMDKLKGTSSSGASPGTKVKNKPSFVLWVNNLLTVRNRLNNFEALYTFTLTYLDLPPPHMIFNIGLVTNKKLFVTTHVLQIKIRHDHVKNLVFISFLCRLIT